MAIRPEEVLRLLRLARLHVEPDEARRLAADLERIVAYVDALGEIELPADAERLTYFDSDVHREDRAAESLAREDALRNAPETDGEHFVVPRIMPRRPEART